MESNKLAMNSSGDNGAPDVADSYVSVVEIRRRFVFALSAMYRAEVPLYQQMVTAIAAENCAAQDSIRQSVDAQKAEPIEMHGAIRLGLPSELAVIRRLFTVMGMFPVGYYDLSVADLPVHSTAFRPISQAVLEQSPFRMFVSLLRLELIESVEHRKQAEEILARREIFSESLLTEISNFEQQGGLTQAQAEVFIDEALAVFRWHSEATVSQSVYQQFKAIHPLIADIVCFSRPHINHLAPQVVDIDCCHRALGDQGFVMKQSIEGPPKRKCSILLRQTAFMAVNESVLFPEVFGSDNTRAISGQHMARFGEIEQRGMALTPKGRALYDSLLNAAERRVKSHSESGDKTSDGSSILADVFSEFPDDLQQLRVLKLGYFRYSLKDQSKPVVDIDQGVANRDVIATPILYEDFLPVSAAGIFRSNLKDIEELPELSMAAAGGSQSVFEQALGRSVIDPFHWYDRQQQASIALCLSHD